MSCVGVYILYTCDTRVRPQGCTLERERRLVSGVATMAHILGFGDEEALASVDFAADVSVPQIAEASAALQVPALALSMTMTL
jgi:hypothetical protein